MLRSEGTIVIAAAAVTTGVLWLSRVIRHRTASLDVAAMSVGIGVAGMAGWIIDTRWTRSVVASFGSFYTNPTEAIGGDHTAIPEGVWRALLQPWYSSAGRTMPVAVIVLLVAGAAIAWRFAPKRTMIPVVVLSLAAIGSVIAVFTTCEMVSGLIPAWPLAIFAAFWLRKEHRTRT